MKMSKTAQRLNKKLLTTLALLNEEASQINGFSHISHTVQFDNFPSSLLVYCHFSEEQHLLTAQNNHIENQLQSFLQKRLLKNGIVLKKPKNNLKLKSLA